MSFRFSSFSSQKKIPILQMILILTVSGTVQAAVHVYSPIVEQGEFELETRADGSSDKDPKLNNARSYNIDVGYGVTSFWATEIETQWKKDPQGSNHYDSTSWENRFQLTQQGEHWLDAGIFFEYENVVQQGDHNSTTLGLLLQKEIGRNLTTANILLNRELGKNGAAGLSTDVRLQTIWRVSPLFQPGFELYAEPGRLGHFDAYEDERIRIGPVAVGTFRTGQLSKIKYELGYLAGTTRATEQSTIRLMLEYEGRF